MASNWPVCPSHSFTELSLLPLTTHLPSAAIATEYTSCWWLSLPKTRYAQFGRRKWRELGTDRTQMRCLLTDVGLSSGAVVSQKRARTRLRPQSDNACFDGRLQFSFVGSFTRRDDRTGDVAHPPLATQSPSPRREVEQGEAAECPSPVPNAFAISRNSRSRTSISVEELARSE